MPFDCFLFKSFLALFLFVQIVFWFTYSLYTCLSTNFLIVCFLVCSVMYTIWVCLFVVLRSFVCLLVCLFVCLLFVCLFTAMECQEQQGRQLNCDCFCFDDNITTETLYYKAYLKIKCFIAIKYKYKSSQLMTQCLHRLCLTSTRRT